VAELADALRGELPWWASAVAAVVLALAGAVARRVARRSAKPQGERLGELERRQDQERIRRVQLEDVLADYGVNLPPWPPDGPRRRPPVFYRDDAPDWTPAPDDDEDQGDEHEEPRTRLAPTIPPLPNYPQHRR